MNFITHDSWSAISECKRYAVHVASVMGKFRHMASFLPGAGKMAQPLGTRNTRAEAEELCRRHAAQYPPATSRAIPTGSTEPSDQTPTDTPESAVSASACADSEQKPCQSEGT